MEELKPRKLASIRIDPGKPPYHYTVENTLEGYQSAVGGYIELEHILIGRVPATVVCNEEGRLKGLQHCCVLNGCEFVGTVLIMSEVWDDDEAQFTDCEASLKQVSEEYYNGEEIWRTVQSMRA